MTPWTIFLLLILGVLLFGGRLPEMARNVGRGILEFQRGMNEWGSEAKKTIFDDEDTPAPVRSESVPIPKTETRETSAPKFEPPAD